MKLFVEGDWQRENALLFLGYSGKVPAATCKTCRQKWSYLEPISNCMQKTGEEVSMADFLAQTSGEKGRGINVGQKRSQATRSRFTTQNIVAANADANARSPKQLLVPRSSHTATMKLHSINVSAFVDAINRGGIEEKLQQNPTNPTRHANPNQKQETSIREHSRY